LFVVDPASHCWQSSIMQIDEIKRKELTNEIRDVIRLEAEGLSLVAESVNSSFCDALLLLAECRGKVVLTGVGKSGLIARKIAATMSSTGTMATFLHPTDGMHGDLGLLSTGDVVIALGKSGESEELVKLIPALKRLSVKLVAITSRRDSTLARGADVVLYAPVEREACPLDLAPTVSTTVALAIGDALAITLMKMKDFKPEDFALYHPGGKLGKRLWLKVSDVMIRVESCARLSVKRAKIEDTLFALTQYGQGIVLFENEDGGFEGILTDGDIRRLLSTHGKNIFQLEIETVLNRRPITIEADCMAVEALKLMEQREKPLNVVPVISQGKIAGILRLHELLSVS
jgi:arabinose-5-phosphate isomerase